MKFSISILFVVLFATPLSGCGTATLGAQLEPCEAYAKEQEKIDCRLRNKTALDEFDRKNQYQPLSKPRKAAGT